LRLQDHLRESVEQAAPIAFLGLVAVRVAVAETDDRGGTGKFEADGQVGGGDVAALRVDGGNGDW
jgi:hypothetical protein